MKLKIITFLLLPILGFCQQNNTSATDSVKTAKMFTLGEVIIKTGKLPIL